jgi:uncharacterized membrane protein
MRNYRLTVCLVICTILLIPIIVHSVQAQNYYEYNVHVQSDGSADWTIIQFSNANATVDSWDIFQQKVFDLVDVASTLTHRPMSIDENSLQINTTVISDSKTTEYSFKWQNFTILRENELVLGDVFQVNDFFSRLYGDAALQINYPSILTVKSVSPAPYSQQNSELLWSRTQDLTSNAVNIVLVDSNQTATNNSNWQLYGVLLILSAAGIVLGLSGFYLNKRRKNNNTATALEGVYPLISEEEKVLRLLKSSGGSMRQSQITEQCRFSKAKTSQLLSLLEKRGNITRYKSGRDKIVTLKERVKGE